MLIRLLFILTLFSCSTNYIVDDRLKPYVDSFYLEGAKRGKTFSKDNLVATIGDTRGGLAEVRIDKNFFGDGQIYLYVDQKYWDKNNAFECVESVVFHELGHAVLDRGHSDQGMSLMNSMNIFHCYKMSSELESLREQLIDELFDATR
jgi:hypothetical protein